MGPLSRAGARIREKRTGRARPRYFVAPSVTFSLEILAEVKAPIKAIMIFFPLPIFFFFELELMSILVLHRQRSTFTSTFYFISCK